MNNKEHLISLLDGCHVPYRTDVDLKQLSYLKTGGIISILVLPETYEQVRDFQKLTIDNNVPYRLIGNTSNILFRDNSSFPVILTLKKLQEITVNKEYHYMNVGAGVLLPAFVRKIAKMGIGGFEGLEGIPGTIGGAIFMNAGAYGSEISDLLIDVTVLGHDGQIKEYHKNELNFSFRSSRFHNEPLGIILKAKFNYSYNKEEKLLEKIDKIKKQRSSALEHEVPNLGSTFATLDIYGELARYNKGYRKLLGLYYWLQKSWIFWAVCVHIFRFKPDYSSLTKITHWYFRWKFNKRPYSLATLNTIINQDGISTQEIEDYIGIIKKLTNNQLKLEIEIW